MDHNGEPLGQSTTSQTFIGMKITWVSCYRGEVWGSVCLTSVQVMPMVLLVQGSCGKAPEVTFLLFHFLLPRPITSRYGREERATVVLLKGSFPSEMLSNRPLVTYTDGKQVREASTEPTTFAPEAKWPHCYYCLLGWVILGEGIDSEMENWEPR